MHFFFIALGSFVLIAVDCIGYSSRKKCQGVSGDCVMNELG